MKADVKIIIKKLEEHYPSVKCALIHKNAYELIISTILSAQCTDKRVNMVTPTLFKKYPTPLSLANADIDELKQIIRSTGFFNSKAKNIKGCASVLINDFNGIVPDNIADLIKLPGVARKTANVVLGVWYKKSEGIAVDTHVRRLTRLLGLTKEEDPVKIEKDLIEIVPKKKWAYFSLALVQYGRDFCSAKKHDYTKCFLGGH